MPNKLKQYFQKARKEGWTIGQFNFSTLEILKGIIQAAEELQSPVILGTSEGESKFFGLEEAVAIVNVYKRKTKLPLFLNLDHGKSLDYIKKAADAGYDAIHIDGSSLPLRENIELTKKAIQICRKKDIFIEGEVGFIKGVSRMLNEAPKITEADLTLPDDALKLVKETGVDSLAVNIGTFHGIDASGQDTHINILRLKEIKEKLGDKVFLVLHGGSGTPKEDIIKAIKLGIVKININTDLRLAYSNALRKSLLEKPKETTPYKYMPEVIIAVQKVAKEKIKLFTQAKRIC
ncbi:MAG: class II fructose-bisphosphate aldolase [bacterium]|nr:class II fructose-bisphosphate aldolase [bacterium]